MNFKCRLCDSKKGFKFLDLGYHPPSDQFLDKKELNRSVKYYPLEVFSCLKCGFKQLGFVVDPKILYQRNYPYESSLTKAGETHYFSFASSVIKRFEIKKNDLVVDIGSNVGTLLTGFKKNKIRVLGIEPAKNICKIAKKKKILTINSFFNNHSVNEIIKKYHKPKILTATNVFAHVDNLKQFIIDVKKLLDKKKGVFIIESPHFYYLLKNLEYDTIYHEHLSYLTIKPLITFFKKYRMEIFDVEKKDIHGGSVRIYVSFRGNYEINRRVKFFCQLEDDSLLNSKKELINFSKKVKENRINLVSLLSKLIKKNKKIIAVSAPAKGMTLLNYCKIDLDYLLFATEKSKLKQGLFTPGTKIPIFSDSEILKHKPDYALLLAWNFSNEIIRNNINFLKTGGKFIIPIPKIKIINYKNFNDKN
jgi:hypothetical protein